MRHMSFGRCVMIVGASLLISLGYGVLTGVIRVTTGTPSYGLSATMLVMPMPHTEKFEKSGVVTRVEKTPHGVTVVLIDADGDGFSRGLWGAIAIHDLKEGDRCTFMWVDHFSSQANSLHGDYFAIKAAE